MGTTFGASLPNPVVLLRHNEGKECAKRGETSQTLSTLIGSSFYSSCGNLE